MSYIDDINRKYKESEWGPVSLPTTLRASLKKPIIADRIFAKLSDLQAYVDDKLTGATEGLIVSVIKDTPDKNGVYMVTHVVGSKDDELSQGWETKGEVVKVGSGRIYYGTDVHYKDGEIVQDSTKAYSLEDFYINNVTGDFFVYETTLIGDVSTVDWSKGVIIKEGYGADSTAAASNFKYYTTYNNIGNDISGDIPHIVQIYHEVPQDGNGLIGLQFSDADFDVNELRNNYKGIETVGAFVKIPDYNFTKGVENTFDIKFHDETITFKVIDTTQELDKVYEPRWNFVVNSKTGGVIINHGENGAEDSEVDTYGQYVFVTEQVFDTVDNKNKQVLKVRIGSFADIITTDSKNIAINKGLATVEDVGSLIEKVLNIIGNNELVTAAALNELNERINRINERIDEVEEVTSISLNELNRRVNDVDVNQYWENI